MNRARIQIAAVLLSVVVSVSAAEPQQARSVQQPKILTFDDDSFGTGHAPSDVVLKALLESRQVKENFDEIEDQSRESLRMYFKAIPVDAGARQDEVYVVNSIKLPLGSGDSDWFWIVQVRKGEAAVILFTIGHTLNFQRHRTNGYRDLLQTTGTPAQPEKNIYRYDGKVYRLIRERLL